MCDVGGRWKQAGIVSYGIGCAHGIYGVNTKLSRYRNWLDDTMREMVNAWNDEEEEEEEEEKRK